MHWVRSRPSRYLPAAGIPVNDALLWLSMGGSFSCEAAFLQVDNRMRAWYIKNMSLGLLYQCNLGDLRLDSPVALLQNRRQDGVDFMEVVPMEHQLPAQRDQVAPPLLPCPCFACCACRAGDVMPGVLCPSCFACHDLHFMLRMACLARHALHGVLCTPCSACNAMHAMLCVPRTSKEP